MSASDERLLLGYKIFDRLRSGFRDGREQLALLLQTGMPPGSAPDLSTPPSGYGSESDGLMDVQGGEMLDWPPDLETVLQQAGQFEPYSMMLGICEDGLPFLLDLTHPAPGALLVAGDFGSGKTRLLRSLLTSTAHLNSPDQALFYIVADNPDAFASLQEAEHCQGLYYGGESAFEALIYELAQTVEDRRRDRPKPPVIILAIDDLDACVRNLDGQVFARLYWLIRHGPRAFVWTVAALSAERSQRVHPRLLQAFRTRLVGHIHDDGQALYLSGDQRLDARWLENGRQFCIPYGEEWLSFWLAEISREQQDAAPESEERVEGVASHYSIDR